ncbi:DUF6783 domain-containing protein [Otoolea muris]|uniref:DUF6783 domain-containing protein n=1 Tax=Otoolea muris TaxID=2941515 RepID=UPI002FE6DF22
MWHKYTAKWGVQMPGMNFQTRSSTGNHKMIIKAILNVAGVNLTDIDKIKE